jgi:hypothetical protein
MSELWNWINLALLRLICDSSRNRTHGVAYRICADRKLLDMLCFKFNLEASPQPSLSLISISLSSTAALYRFYSAASFFMVGLRYFRAVDKINWHVVLLNIIKKSLRSHLTYQSRSVEGAQKSELINHKYELELSLGDKSLNVKFAGVL